MQNVYKIIGDSTAIPKVKITVDGLDELIIGFVINDTELYVLNTRCSKTLSKQFKTITIDELTKCITDILDVLVKLDNNKYVHGDLKPDNIMLCNSKYMLVDWELSTSHEELKNRIFERKDYNVGARAYSSPLLHYITYGRQLNIIAMFSLLQEGFKAKSFDQELDRINDKISQIIQNGYGDQIRLFDYYKSTFDLFNLGIVILKALAHKEHTDDLEWNRIRIFAQKCTLSDEDPFLNPQAANAPKVQNI